MREQIKNISKVVTQNVNLSKEIESLTIINRNIRDTKKIVKVNLINEIFISNSDYILYKFEFESFPEWAVSMSRLQPVFTVLNGYNIRTISFTNYFRYRWNKIDDNKMILEVLFSYSGQSGMQGVLDLIIVNENKFS